MKKLEIEEMKSIMGGGISAWGIVGIGALLTFLSGLVDGLARPFKCH